MLNGIAPIIIFTFPIETPGAISNAISGIPLVGKTIIDNVGIPIPIYMDEKLTGIYVESESKTIDIETTTEAKIGSTDTPDVSQRGLSNSVTVNMVGLKTSVTLTALLALIDMVFQRVVSQNYNVTYLNGPTTIFNGLIDGFSVNADNDSELVSITLTMSKANKKIKKTDTIPVPERATGITPLSAVK